MKTLIAALLFIALPAESRAAGASPPGGLAAGEAPALLDPGAFT